MLIFTCLTTRFLTKILIKGLVVLVKCEQIIYKFIIDKSLQTKILFWEITKKKLKTVAYLQES